MSILDQIERRQRERAREEALWDWIFRAPLIIAALIALAVWLL